MDNWKKLPILGDDALGNLDNNLTDYPVPGDIVPCLLCTKPFMMRMYTGAPDQVVS